VSRRQVYAAYASALLAAGRVGEAVTAGRRATVTPADDVRSEVAAFRVLAEALVASGERTAARTAAQRAVRVAYATQQAGERAAADAVLARAVAAPAD
jgi:hypothetical protein